MAAGLPVDEFDGSVSAEVVEYGFDERPHGFLGHSVEIPVGDETMATVEGEQMKGANPDHRGCRRRACYSKLTYPRALLLSERVSTHLQSKT